MTPSKRFRSVHVKLTVIVVTAISITVTISGWSALTVANRGITREINNRLQITAADRHIVASNFILHQKTLAESAATAGALSSDRLKALKRPACAVKRGNPAAAGVN